jgi:hypothetical protein
MLEDIYKWVLCIHGKEAANNFVEMVEDIPKLTMTDFLLSLFDLENCNWKWKKRPSVGAIEVAQDKNGEYNLASGLSSVFGVLCGMSDVDETESIRRPFLNSHSKKKKEKMFTTDGLTTDGYHFTYNRFYGR